MNKSIDFSISTMRKQNANEKAYQDIKLICKGNFINYHVDPHPNVEQLLVSTQNLLKEKFGKIGQYDEELWTNGDAFSKKRVKNLEKYTPPQHPNYGEMNNNGHHNKQVLSPKTAS